MTPERLVKMAVRRVLDEYGCWYFMPMMNGYGRTGIPDFVGCYKGKFFAIEAKAEGGTVTPNQQRELLAIVEHDGVCVVAKGETAEQQVRRMLDGLAL